jgi:hypothetical protein
VKPSYGNLPLVGRRQLCPICLLVAPLRLGFKCRVNRCPRGFVVVSNEEARLALLRQAEKVATRPSSAGNRTDRRRPEGFAKPESGGKQK